jgi:hypothetical protein
MAEMKRKDNENDDQDRRSNEGMGSNRDSRNEQQPSGGWDGNERRTGSERRNSDMDMQMNEGSNR